MKTVIKIPVRGYHVDHFGHVNHGRFVELLEEARWHYLDANGLMGPIHEAGGVHVVVHIDVRYLCPARAGDRLRIETQVAGRSAKSFTMSQAVFLDGSDKAAVRAVVTNVFVDEYAKPKEVTGKLLEAWPDLAQALKTG